MANARSQFSCFSPTAHAYAHLRRPLVAAEFRHSLHAFLHKAKPISGPEFLRFGLLAAALALVQAQLDLLKQPQADIARDLRLSRGFAGIGRWSVTRCPRSGLKTLDVFRTQF